ncbi:MAG: crosslink repair DNA glycosylase YcaQ family protein, partial [Myxococcota bacterium]
MKLIQLDSVNVVVRSHYMPLFSRLGPYRMDSLDSLAYARGELFEYWGHVASLLPISHYPMFRYRMELLPRRSRRARDLRARDRGYVESVLEEIRARGPLTVGDLEDPGKRTGPWWGYGKGKIALEALYTSGHLAVKERRGFTRVYDLAERVIPKKFLEKPPLSRDEANREMLRLAADAHGVGTVRDLADYYRIPMPRARARIRELLEEGDLRRVRVEGWREPGYVARGARILSRIDASALLTPFDPVVWERERAERLFGFHYRIEIYVPPGERRYGYYVMPFLLGEELVARVDLKSERDRGRLLVRGAFVEPGHPRGTVAGALARELSQLAEWLGLESVA